MKITYDIARQEDIEIIWQFAKELIEKYEDPGIVDIKKVLRWVHGKIESQIDTYQVILADGKKAGYIRKGVVEGELELDDLYLFPEYRGIGIGTAVIKEAIKNTELPVFFYVFVKNIRAVSLYQRLGFELCEKVSETRYIMRSL